MIQRLTSLFAVWTVLGTLWAWFLPDHFVWVADGRFKPFGQPLVSVLLGVIMLGMGLTLSFDDFKRVLKPAGRYVFVGGPMRLVLEVLFLGPLVSLFTKKRMGILAVRVNQGLDFLEDQVRFGKLKPVIDRRYRLRETPNAFRQLGEGRANGKLVIEVQGE